MGNPVAGTIRGELEGLRVAIVGATATVITRTPTVRNRDITGFFDGPWPLIVIRYADYRVDLLGGGVPYAMGQTLKNPNLYTVELEDVVAANSSIESEAVSASQDDLIDLTDAIIAWFDHMPHRCLPTNYGAMAGIAGIPIRFRGEVPFTDDRSGVVVQMKGVIGVQGVRRVGSSR